MSVRIGIVGAGKMGLSHFAIANAHPAAEVAAICDRSRLVLGFLAKYARVATYRSFEEMLAGARLDAIIVSTPTATHFPLAKRALEHGLHVFVEKPLTLAAEQSEALAALADARGRVNQVGFHNRFLGTFREARRLVAAGALGKVESVRGTAFGQVVVRARGSTWRSRRAEGGGCLHDYASHVLDLMSFVVGPPASVERARLESIWSADVEDAVHVSFAWASGTTGELDANWSDERFRKMTTALVVEGSGGRLAVDRQELRVDLAAPFERYPAGRSARFITDLQGPVAYYLRGEEYTAQLDAFVEAIRAARPAAENSFASASVTDALIERIQRAGDAAA